jgi:DNA-binding transcriptional MerR regulator
VEATIVSKGPEAFRTISEAATEVGVPQHVLRFWETKFSFIRPMKRAGGRRFYRPQDLTILRGVRRLLHDEGYTIMGVQRLHRDHGVGRLIEAGGGEGAVPAEVAPIPADGPFPDDVRAVLGEALEALQTAKARLDAALGG